jgi:excisionase family DNA binding protein
VTRTASSIIEERRLVTAREAADYLGCSIFTIRNLARQGHLRAVKFKPGGNWRFPREDLEALTSCSRPSDEGGVGLGAADVPLEKGFESAPLSSHFLDFQG